MHDVPAATQGRVYIAGAVPDDRQFQNKASDPSIPSIDGDVTKLSAQENDRMVGHWRNSCGKASGDIGLYENDSVTKRVRLLVEQGLSRKGYQVTADPNVPNSIVVSINDVWVWGTSGLWALTFETCTALTSRRVFAVSRIAESTHHRYSFGKSTNCPKVTEETWPSPRFISGMMRDFRGDNDGRAKAASSDSLVERRCEDSSYFGTRETFRAAGG
jgi:hypothetical protein